MSDMPPIVPPRGYVGYEAVCGDCGETFNPDGPNDLIHAERADGEECGGQGELTGAWK